MNDVLNSQGYTQAAWWNRIPHAAWALMVLIAVCSNLLVGYGARNTRGGGILLFVLPLVVSIAFLLIADIDSPRGGLIHVYPQNLQSLLKSLPSQKCSTGSHEGLPRSPVVAGSDHAAHTQSESVTDFQVATTGLRA
jgi:hypothetical protein